MHAPKTHNKTRSENGYIRFPSGFSLNPFGLPFTFQSSAATAVLRIHFEIIELFCPLFYDFFSAHVHAQGLRNPDTAVLV